jgi:hypothetical protein
MAPSRGISPTQPIIFSQRHLKTTSSLDDVRSPAALGSLQDLPRAMIPVRSSLAPRFHQPDEPGRIFESLQQRTGAACRLDRPRKFARIRFAVFGAAAPTIPTTAARTVM